MAAVFPRRGSRSLLYLLLVMPPVLCLGGCPEPPTKIPVTLTVTASPADAGTVTISPQQATYYQGDQVSLTAVPGESHKFDHWTGQASGTTNPLQLTLSGDTTIQAVFVSKDTVEPEVSDSLRILPQTVQVRTLASDQVELQGQGLPNLVPGDVIFSASNGGVLGRVRTIAATAGVTTVQIAPAALTDVVKRAHIAVNTASLPLAARSAGLRAASRIQAASVSVEDGVLVLDLSGAELELEDACTITLTDGTLRFDPTFNLVMDIDDFQLNRFKLSAAGTLQLSMDVEAEITRATDKLKKEITLAEAEFFRGVAMAGPIPVEYVFFASIKLGAEVRCGEAGTITGGFDISAGVQAGAEYANDSWTPIGEFTFDANPHLPAVNLHPAEITVYAEPEIGVKFYEVVGPSISFKDYAKIVADYRHDRIGTELHKGSEINLNFELKVPKIDLAKLSYGKTLYDSSYVMLARLAFATDPAGMGDIAWSPDAWLGSGFFWYTTPVTVTGTPKPGNRLAAYGIDYLCRDKTVLRSADMALQDEPIDGSKLVTAYFVPLKDGEDWTGSGNTTETGPYTLTREVFPAEAGSIVVFPARSGYKSGTRLLIEARPERGFRFHHWEKGLSGTEAVAQKTISGNTTVRAVFESVVPRLLKVPQDYATIQEAIDAATYGDQINLDSETFSGDGNRDLRFNGKHLTIHGFSTDNTIIDLGGSSSHPHRLAELWDVAGTVTFTNLTVQNGYAGNSQHVGYPNYAGGAIMLGEQSSVYVGFCRFVNCHAPGDGGAIWYDDPFVDSDSHLTVTETRFESCTASSDGGAIYVRNPTIATANVNVNNCTFVSNTAGADGGAVDCPEFVGSFEVSDCTFTGNVASTGGAVRLARVTGTAQIRSCAFSNNRSNGLAGALACEGNLLGKGGSLAVRQCTFTGNTAKNYAGAVTTTSPGDYAREPVIVEACEFTSNSSADAGAISLGTSTGMRHCTFNQNIATSDAGAAIIAGIASDCTFTANSAGDNGGAVKINPGGVVESCEFAGNSAGLWGGAVWIGYAMSHETPGILSACTLQNNTAKGGGAIKADAGTIRNCRLISGNQATLYHGGGIAANKACILNCTIANNTASQSDGGGLALNECLVSGCTVVDNTAAKAGGGIQDHDSVISYSTITDNTAANGGGIWCSDTQIFSSILDGNTPDNCTASAGDTCCEGL